MQYSAMLDAVDDYKTTFLGTKVAIVHSKVDNMIVWCMNQLGLEGSSAFRGFVVLDDSFASVPHIHVGIYLQLSSS